MPNTPSKAMGTVGKAGASRPASRRGRKPITDPLHLTPSERHLLSWVDSRGSGPEGVPATKQAIATDMGLNVKTVDKSVSRLRRRGMVEVVPCYAESSGQVSNVYRVTLLARRTYPELFS